MKNIKKLKEIKNGIINKVISYESLFKISKNKKLNGGFWKNYFKYMFLKPYILKGNKTKEDIFFIIKEAYDSGDEINKPKHLLTCLSLIFSFGLMINLFFNDPNLMILNASFCLIMMTAYTGLFFYSWKEKNMETSKTTNEDELNNIIEKLFLNDNEVELKKILHKKLTKNELESALHKINESVSKEELFRAIERVNGGRECITEPYELLKVMNELINNTNNTKEKKNELGINVNKMIIENLLNKEKEIPQLEMVGKFQNRYGS